MHTSDAISVNVSHLSEVSCHRLLRRRLFKICRGLRSPARVALTSVTVSSCLSAGLPWRLPPYPTSLPSLRVVEPSAAPQGLRSRRPSTVGGMGRAGHEKALWPVRRRPLERRPNQNLACDAHVICWQETCVVLLCYFEQGYYSGMDNGGFVCLYCLEMKEL